MIFFDVASNLQSGSEVGSSVLVSVVVVVVFSPSAGVKVSVSDSKN